VLTLVYGRYIVLLLQQSLGAMDLRYWIDKAVGNMGKAEKTQNCVYIHIAYQAD